MPGSPAGTRRAKHAKRRYCFNDDRVYTISDQERKTKVVAGRRSFELTSCGVLSYQTSKPLLEWPRILSRVSGAVALTVNS